MTGPRAPTDRGWPPKCRQCQNWRASPSWAHPACRLPPHHCPLQPPARPSPQPPALCPPRPPAPCPPQPPPAPPAPPHPGAGLGTGNLPPALPLLVLLLLEELSPGLSARPSCPELPRAAREKRLGVRGAGASAHPTWSSGPSSAARLSRHSTGLTNLGLPLGKHSGASCCTPPPLVFGQWCF